MIRSSCCCCCCSKSICRISSVFTLHVKGKENEDDKKKVEKNKGPIHKHEYSINFTNNNNNKKNPKDAKGNRN